MDTQTAQALINKQPGLAVKVLYSIKQALDSKSKDFQVSDDPSRQQDSVLKHHSKTVGKCWAVPRSLNL